jgi:uncharacterized protein (DUF362 family)
LFFDKFILGGNMSKKISRRDFLKKSTQIGVASTLGGTILPGLLQGPDLHASPGIDIAVAKGTDYLKGTSKAVELLGGMSNFVPKGSKVAILPNTQRNNPGAFTKPEIVRATIRMCKEAGASEVNCLSWLPRKAWEPTGLAAAVEEEGANLKLVDMKDESLYKSVPLPKGKALKEAKIMKAFFENDVFIDMPITKDHIGNKFTGTMKNYMGLNLQASNMFFHTGKFKEPDDIPHLDQCIADLNLAAKPTLCIVDATEFITTNGPFGPGKLAKPQKIVAGVDRVAIDAYCCTLWGLNPQNIIMIKRGFEHGLGEIDLKKVKIKETAV